jgi:hypothetical protein
MMARMILQISLHHAVSTSDNSDIVSATGPTSDRDDLRCSERHFSFVCDDGRSGCVPIFNSMKSVKQRLMLMGGGAEWLVVWMRLSE